MVLASVGKTDDVIFNYLSIYCRLTPSSYRSIAVSLDGLGVMGVQLL